MLKKRTQKWKNDRLWKYLCVTLGAEDVSVETLVTVSSSKSKYRGKKLPVRLVKERKPVDLDKVSAFSIMGTIVTFVQPCP